MLVFILPLFEKKIKKQANITMDFGLENLAGDYGEPHLRKGPLLLGGNEDMHRLISRYRRFFVTPNDISSVRRELVIWATGGKPG